MLFYLESDQRTKLPTSRGFTNPDWNKRRFPKRALLVHKHTSFDIKSRHFKVESATPGAAAGNDFITQKTSKL